MSNSYSVVVIGGGPAAWTAATYLSRAEIKLAVIVGERVGGQLMLTTEVENFPGFEKGIDGPQLMIQMREQAERFGSKVIEETATSIEPSGESYLVKTDRGEYLAQAVIVATGAEAVWMKVPGEKEFIGRGVSACAVCDAAFFRDKPTVVVGGGDAAMEDALALARFAGSVTIVHRREAFRASKIMVERVLKNQKIKVRWNSVVTEIVGEGKVSGVRLKDTVTGEENELPTEGVFVAIGHRPATEFLGELVKTSDKGYVYTRVSYNQVGNEMARAALNDEGQVLFPTMTSREGIFAAGDCVDFRYRQASTAAGMGVMAALDAQWWLETK